MLTYPNFSPEIFTLGPLTVRWYGLMYIFGFITAWFLGRKRAKTHAWITPLYFEEMLTCCIVGIILGARIGYALFYDTAYYIAHPLKVFAVWQGGMSFHGGLLGVLIALWYCSYKYKKPFFDFVDFVAPLVAPGLFFGRIGNFLNAELWGRVTDAPLGMVFPGAGALPRHPSQLYEAFFEGLVLFLLLWWFSAKPRPRMVVSGFFAVGYSVFRFSMEFFREPDAHLGFMALDFLTMGMLLSLPMFLYGVYLLWRGCKNNKYAVPFVCSVAKGVRR